jgi:septal ring factor EnvC (AmiA/AmiB activator)
MKDFLQKKYRFMLVIGIVLGLFILNIYLYKDSKNLTEIKSDLELENYKLNLDIKKSQAKEEKLIKEISDKIQTIDRIKKELTGAHEKHQRLKRRLAVIDTPENPEHFTQIEQCKEKYLQLAKDLNLCQQTEQAAEIALNLCQNKSQQQKNVINLQELTYLECQEQRNLIDKKIKETEAAMERLDRFYKRRLLKRNTIKYTVGIIVGILAGYFMFKKRH